MRVESVVRNSRRSVVVVALWTVGIAVLVLIGLLPVMAANTYTEYSTQAVCGCRWKFTWTWTEGNVTLSHSSGQNETDHASLSGNHEHSMGAIGTNRALSGSVSDGGADDYLFPQGDSPPLKVESTLTCALTHEQNQCTTCAAAERTVQVFYTLIGDVQGRANKTAGDGALGDADGPGFVKATLEMKMSSTLGDAASCTCEASPALGQGPYVGTPICVELEGAVHTESEISATLSSTLAYLFKKVNPKPGEKGDPASICFTFCAISGTGLTLRGHCPHVTGEKNSASVKAAGQLEGCP